MDSFVNIENRNWITQNDEDEVYIEMETYNSNKHAEHQSLYEDNMIYN